MKKNLVENGKMKVSEKVSENGKSEKIIFLAEKVNGTELKEELEKDLSKEEKKEKEEKSILSKFEKMEADFKIRMEKMKMEALKKLEEKEKTEFEKLLLKEKLEKEKEEKREKLLASILPEKTKLENEIKKLSELLVATSELIKTNKATLKNLLSSVDIKTEKVKKEKTEKTEGSDKVKKVKENSVFGLIQKFITESEENGISKDELIQKVSENTTSKMDSITWSINQLGKKTNFLFEVRENKFFAI